MFFNLLGEQLTWHDNMSNINVQLANLFWCQDISAPHPVTFAIVKLIKSRWDVIMSSTAMSPGFVFMQVEYNGGAQILIDCYFQLRRWVSCLSTLYHYPSSNCALQNWSAENEALVNIDLPHFKNNHIANTALWWSSWSCRDFVNYFKERVVPKANRLGKWALGEVSFSSTEINIIPCIYLYIPIWPY